MVNKIIVLFLIHELRNLILKLYGLNNRNQQKNFTQLKKFTVRYFMPETDCIIGINEKHVKNILFSSLEYNLI